MLQFTAASFLLQSIIDTPSEVFVYDTFHFSHVLFVTNITNLSGNSISTICVSEWTLITIYGKTKKTDLLFANLWDCLGKDSSLIGLKNVTTLSKSRSPSYLQIIQLSTYLTSILTVLYGNQGIVVTFNGHFIPDGSGIIFLAALNKTANSWWAEVVVRILNCHVFIWFWPLLITAHECQIIMGKSQCQI